MEKMGKCVKGYLGAIVFLLILMVMPIKAEAANYRLVNVSTGQNGVRTKVGGYYFWSQWKEGKGNQIFASKSSTSKKGTLLATPRQLDSSCTILTNGVKVYYANDDSQKKHTLYEVGANGKNRKKIATVSGNEMFLVNYYDGYIYYNAPVSSGYTLCRISVKTKKAKTLAKKVYPQSLTGGDRYICMKSGEGSKYDIQIYDCKKRKVAGKHTIKKSSSQYVGNTVLTKNYIYCSVQGGAKEKVYRCAIDGSGSMKLFVRLGKDSYFGGADDQYIYYSDLEKDENGTMVSKFYRMRVTDMKVGKISEEKYIKAVS